ncbi:hypothetical protein [Nocardia miyunensis]|uniref:hypothetical protein n=1 Tax=Nocardia miyunensis TaxID=282684 RepID=UPI000A4C3C7A|nr:hypothetical protein [Nocardia miyunensis]
MTFAPRIRVGSHGRLVPVGVTFPVPGDADDDFLDESSPTMTPGDIDQREADDAAQ